MVSVKNARNAAGVLSQNDKEAASILCTQFQEVFVNYGDTDLMQLVSTTIHHRVVTCLPKNCLPRTLFSRN